MTAPKPAVGPPSASGVRRGGDRFQDLFVWGAALQLIRPGSTYTQIEVEINGVGNLDDVILRSYVAGGDFAQVKWATNAAEPLSEAFLLKRPTRSGRPAGRSLLQKLHAGYLKVRGDGPAPRLRLITNRALDGADPLLGNIDGRTQLLVPRAAQAEPGSAVAEAVDRWAQHLEAPRQELLELLAALEFHTGRTVPAERDQVRTLMVAAGLEDSVQALQLGLDIVASWVVDGRRVITANDVDKAIDDRKLRRSDPSAILVVQAIDLDPHPHEATVAVNWVHLFDQEQPHLRVQPRDPTSWELMDRELAAAATELESAGWKSIVVRGAMRQATFFRVGTLLPAVRQHTLHYIQRGQLWSTDAPKIQVAAPVVHRTELNTGIDLAIAVGVSTDPTTAVAAYLQSQTIPIGSLVTVQPAGGADDQAVVGAGQAVAYAQLIRDQVRHELEHQPDADHVHLFLAGPGGLALLLGHRWNRVRPTIVYEHLGPGRGYLPAFTVDS